MRDIIVGTAGHIDHGKSALVRALTGIEPDRLAEEKRRGISIELGFAHLHLEGGINIGFIDVPGHERFIRNMLAGAGGIDMVLLVVACDEGVKPQTREHFEICRLLGVRHCVVALTKSDLVDESMLELAQLDVAELLAGSLLENSPMVAVSNVTGAGLDQLKRALVEAASLVAPRDSQGPFRLPIDRAFSIRGFGTVVTGTLWSGSLRVESEVALYPGNRGLRVRGLQVHGGAVEQAHAGQRTAVNLAGAEAAEIERGMVLAPAGCSSHPPSSTAALNSCALLLLSSTARRCTFMPARRPSRPRLRLLGDVGKPLQPGESAWLRLVLQSPVLLLPGDRFIVRMFSPVVTIGGGVVADNAPPSRWKRPAIVGRLPSLIGASLPERVRMHALESPDGARVASLAARCGVTPDQAAAAGVAARCLLLRDPEPRLLPEESFESQTASL